MSCRARSAGGRRRYRRACPSTTCAGSSAAIRSRSQHHMIAEVDGVIASARMLLVQPVRFRGERLLSFQPVDVAVAPQFQGLGMTQRLTLDRALEDPRHATRQRSPIKLYIRSWHPAVRRLRERIGVSGYAFGNRMIALERPNNAPHRARRPHELARSAACPPSMNASNTSGTRPLSLSRSPSTAASTT